MTWWLCLLIILLAIVIFELGVKALLAAYFPTDEDHFQVLEKDPLVKRRLEEAASEELQAGWDRKTNRERDGEEKVREVVQEFQAKEEERRENEVRELLRGRVEVLGSQEQQSGGELAGEVSAAEVDRKLSKGFGKVRRD